VYPATGDTVVLLSNIKTRRSVPRVSPRLIASVEERDFTRLGRRKLTPAQLKQILSICDEIGALGEQLVLAAERKRLRQRGLNAQADKVERVSLWSVGEGYDILSFENDGVTKRHLEVKTTTGKGTVVDVSRAEWKTAARLKDRYYLVRVVSVRNAPQMFFIRDPCALEKQGIVVRTPSG
jgi:Domain of unknown function (DUF3883)